MQTASVKEIKNDLKELENCPGVKERFQEMTEAEQKVARQWDSSELKISGIIISARDMGLQNKDYLNFMIILNFLIRNSQISYLSLKIMSSWSSIVELN